MSLHIACARCTHFVAYAWAEANGPVAGDRVDFRIVELAAILGGDDLVEGARRRRLDVSAETRPRYLLLDDSCYHEPDFGGAKCVMRPLLRTRSDVDALREAVVSGEQFGIRSKHGP